MTKLKNKKDKEKNKISSITIRLKWESNLTPCGSPFKFLLAPEKMTSEDLEFTDFFEKPLISGNMRK